MSCIETLQCEVSLVKSVQDKMAELLIRAPFLSDEEEQHVLRKYIDLLRTRSEEMIIFIQVMLKVKQELAYARLDLERAVRLNTGVNEGRKRVKWLSERLKKLSKMCHNYFCDLQKEISKVAIDGDNKFNVYQSCICGTMATSVEEVTLGHVQNSVKKVLEASSDVSVYKKGQSYERVFKPSRSPEYEDEDDEQFEQSNEEEAVGKTLNPMSYNSLALPHPEGIPKKNEDPLFSIGVQRKKTSKLDSLINYQNEALDQLLEKFNHLYAHTGKTSVLPTSSVEVEPSSNNSDTSKEFNDANTKIPTDGSLAEIKSKNSVGCIFSQHSNVSDEGVISTMLIPKKDVCVQQRKKKKEVFPRSPSVWCEYGSCSSSKLIQDVKSSVSGKERRKVSKYGMEPMKGEKSVVMKRAVNRIKVLTKLKKVSQISNEDLVKKRRIESLLGNSGIHSDNKCISVDAAKALGQLKCRDEIVITGLKIVIEESKEKLLVYQCAKSMISLGSWLDSAMGVLTYHLKYGNKKVQEDILLTLKESDNAHFIPKTSDALLSLSNALVNLINGEDTDLAFNAALSLGYLCINTEGAKWLLLDSLRNGSYTTKYEALNVLVKQMNCQNDDVINALLLQVSTASCWKHRMQAIHLIGDIGLKRLKQYGLKHVFEVLQELLWNHSNTELRSKVVAVLEEFGLRKEAAANVLKRLNDKSASVRADSIVALATLGMKGERELKILLDMFDLDSSTRVRTQVINAFVEMKWNHPHVLRVLEERQRADDVLAKQALKAFNFLGELST